MDPSYCALLCITFVIVIIIIIIITHGVHMFHEDNKLPNPPPLKKKGQSLTRQ